MALGVRIVEFANLDDIQLARAAHVLREALPSPAADKAPGEAEAEVARVRDHADRFGYAALVGGELAGWIGAVRGYSHSLELHPLVVDSASQRRGVGTALVYCAASPPSVPCAVGCAGDFMRCGSPSPASTR